jgi:phosphatidylglycerophosphate synthase
MAEIGDIAIILPPQSGDWHLPTQPVAGLPVLLRIILTAERVGIRRVMICSGEATPHLQPLLNGRSFQSEIRWFDPAGKGLREILEGQGTAPCFLIRATTLLTPSVFSQMRAAFHPGAGRLVPAGQGPDGPLLLGKPEALKDRDGPLEEVPLSGSAVCLDLATTPVKEGEDHLYRALGKPTDSLMIRWSRVLLLPFLTWVVKTRISPNQITLTGFLIGLLAILCLWQGSYILTVVGASLFVVAYLVDLLDGMVARLKFQESRWGGWMDYNLDNLIHLGIFAAIVKAVYTKKPDQIVLVLGGFLIAGAVMSGVVIALKKIRPTQEINRFLAMIMHRDFSLIVLLAALFDRLEWFLWAAAIGINLFWPFVLYLLLIRERRVPASAPKEHPGLSSSHIKGREVGRSR